MNDISPDFDKVKREAAAALATRLKKDRPTPAVDKAETEPQRLAEFELVKSKAQEALQRHFEASQSGERVEWLTATKDIQTLLPDLDAFGGLATELKNKISIETSKNDEVFKKNSNRKAGRTIIPAPSSVGETPEQKKARELGEFLPRAKEYLVLAKDSFKSPSGNMLDGRDFNSVKSLLPEANNFSGPEIEALKKEILAAIDEAETAYVAFETKELNSFVAQAESAFTIPDVDQYPNHRTKVEMILTSFKSPWVSSPKANRDRQMAMDRAEERLKELDKQYEAAKKVVVPATPDTRIADIGEAWTMAEFKDAQQEFMKAKAEHEKAQGVMSHFGKGKAAKGVAAAEAEKARQRYETARAEFVGADTRRYIEAKMQELETQAASGKDKSWIDKLQGWSNRLGEFNLVDKGVYKGKFLRRTVKFLNARTAINASLAGIGILSGSGIVAGSAMIARRIFSGTTSGLGTYGLIENARRANLDKKLSADASLDQIEETMAALESRATLDGSLDKLLLNEHYNDLINHRLLKLRETMAGLTEAQVKDMLTAGSLMNDELLKTKLSEEKKWKRLAKIGGLGMGIFVGSGAMGKVFSGVKNMLTGHHETIRAVTSAAKDAPTGPTTEIPKPPVSTVDTAQAVTKATGANMEVPKTPVSGVTEAVKPAPSSFGQYFKPKPLSHVDFTGQTHASGAGAGHLSNGDYAKPVHLAEEANKAATGTAEKVALKAGAWFEMQNGEAILHAGKRGLEGAMIDLKETNPDLYGKMIAKLHEQFPDYHGSDNGLIDNFVRHSGHADWGVDTGTDHDLSQIRAGEIHIGEKVELGDKFDFIKSTDQIPHHVPGVADAAHQHYVPDAGHLENSDYANPVHLDGTHGTLRSVFSPHRDVNWLDHHHGNLADSSDSDSPQHVDYSQPSDSAVSPETPLSSAQAVHDARIEAALQQPGIKANEALRLVFDGDNRAYSKFIEKSLGLNERKINALSKLNLVQFLRQFGNSKTYSNLVGKLIELNGELINNFPNEQFNDSTPMRKILVYIAERYK